MPDTRDFVPIDKITNNSVILKDGSVAVILQTSAVNFDLLSEQEQLAIIGSFAALLNSLSFSIQILIRSKKLDISHYLNTLKEAERKQHNPLLQLMMQHYRAFVAAIIRDNEVLDKQFFVILAVSPIELGVVKSSDTEKSLEKALTILNPRVDHILKQLSRIGLKSDKLDDERLIRLFYDIYNDEEKISLSDIQANPANQTPTNAAPPPQPPIQPITPAGPYVAPPAQTVAQVQASKPVMPPPPAPIQPPPAQPQSETFQSPPLAQNTQPQPTPHNQPPGNLYSSSQQTSHNPFVVEELPGWKFLVLKF